MVLGEVVMQQVFVICFAAAWSCAVVVSNVLFSRSYCSEAIVLMDTALKSVLVFVICDITAGYDGLTDCRLILHSCTCTVSAFESALQRLRDLITPRVQSCINWTML